MKKVKLMMMTLMMCLMTSVVFGQWTYETIYSGPSESNEDREAREAFNMNSEFGESWSEIRRAYTESNNGGSLAMTVLVEFTHNDIIKPIRYDLTLWGSSLWGSSFCYASYIDVILVVNGENKKYKLRSKSINGNKCVFDESIWTDEFIKDFKSASKCYIMVKQNDGSIKYYQFDFSGAAAAYNFITK